ncbi:hypothetical protein ACOME3_000105 [Neoechinorhynchus agilis]
MNSSGNSEEDGEPVDFSSNELDGAVLNVLVSAGYDTVANDTVSLLSLVSHKYLDGLCRQLRARGCDKDAIEHVMNQRNITPEVITCVLDFLGEDGRFDMNESDIGDEYIEPFDDSYSVLGFDILPDEDEVERSEDGQVEYIEDDFDMCDVEEKYNEKGHCPVPTDPMQIICALMNDHNHEFSGNFDDDTVRDEIIEQEPGQSTCSYPSNKYESDNDHDIEDCVDCDTDDHYDTAQVMDTEDLLDSGFNCIDEQVSDDYIGEPVNEDDVNKQIIDISPLPCSISHQESIEVHPCVIDLLTSLVDTISTASEHQSQRRKQRNPRSLRPRAVDHVDYLCLVCGQNLAAEQLAISQIRQCFLCRRWCHAKCLRENLPGARWICDHCQK